MKRIVLVTLILVLTFVHHAQSSSDRILIYAGAASKPATEEIVKDFKEKTGIVPM